MVTNENHVAIWRQLIVKLYDMRERERKVVK